MLNDTPIPPLHVERGWLLPKLAQGLILALFITLVLNHAAALPLFEASDEAPHFIYAHGIATTGQLPIIPTRADLDSAAEHGDTVAQWSIESHQPPLYYALGAALIAPTTTRANLPDYLIPNDVIFTWGITAGNPNVWLHPVHDTGGDTANAVWILRLFSLALSCGTLILLYRAIFLATNSTSIALTAMFAAASLPMFVIVSGSVTNDTLIIFLSTAGVWCCLRILTFGLHRFDAIVIGLILSAAALTKITGLALFGLLFISLILAYRGGKISLRQAIVTFASAGVMTAVLTGWWYLRNLSLYGDFLATAATAELWGRQFGTAGESGGWQEFARIYNSFWLMIGHLHAPIWASVGFYGATVAFIAASVAGWIRIRLGEKRRTDHSLSVQAVALLGLAAALPMMMLLVGTKDVDISYGRLLFPGLVGFIALLVIGWHGLIRRFAPLLILPLTFTSVLMPYILTTPAYASLTTLNQLPESAVPLNVTANGLRLDGYEMLDKSVAPNGSARAALYFTSTAPTPIVFAVSLTEGPTRLGGTTLYAGMATGKMLTMGQMYRAVVTVPLTAPTNNAMAHLTQLQIALFDAPESPALPLMLPDGQTSQVLTLDGATYLDPDVRPVHQGISADATFGDAIRLNSYGMGGEAKAGDFLAFALDWSVIGDVPPDLSATMQLLDETGTLIAQYDDPSVIYPSRSWVKGTNLVTHHRLALPSDLPTGTYTLAVGWYRLDENFTRLPAIAPETTNHLAIIERITVTP